jgi:hypothetical protein
VIKFCFNYFNYICPLSSPSSTISEEKYLQFHYGMNSKIFVLLILVCVNINVLAQLSAVDYKSNQFAQFKASKTYFVKTGNEKFDTDVTTALKDLWKITSFGAIDNNDFETRIADESASFLLPIIITYETQSSLNSTRSYTESYHFFALINGGKKKLSKYTYADMIAYCPLNHYIDEPKMTDCNFRVINMLESMIAAINIVQEKDIRGNPKKIVDSLMDFYCTKSARIKERTLLFCLESLGNKITSGDIAGLYPFRFEICTREKIEQLIREKSKDYYYFQPAVTNTKSMFVFDPSNGEVVYAGYDAGLFTKMLLDKGNIQYLVKAIQGIK